MGDYTTFDFGKSYYRDSRCSADQGEAAGLDLARPMDDLPLLRHFDSARRPQGGEGRHPFRHRDLGGGHRRLCDSWLPLRDAADRALCGGSFWQIFPLRGLTSDNFAELVLVAQDSRLSLAHHLAGDGDGDRLLCDLDAP